MALAAEASMRRRIFDGYGEFGEVTLLLSRRSLAQLGAADTDRPDGQLILRDRGAPVAVMIEADLRRSPQK